LGSCTAADLVGCSCKLCRHFVSVLYTVPALLVRLLTAALLDCSHISTNGHVLPFPALTLRELHGDADSGNTTVTAANPR